MGTSAWSAPVTVNVLVAPVITASATLPAGQVDVDYDAPITTTGSTPRTYAVTSGSVPPGTGIVAWAEPHLQGRPTASGTYTFTLQSVNAIGSNSKAFTVTVAAASSASAARITAVALPTGYVGEAYSYQLPLAGSTPITVAAASLPSGWACSSAGVLSAAAPTALDAHEITFTPSNALGAGEPITLPITVVARPGAGAYRFIADRPGATTFSQRRNR